MCNAHGLTFDRTRAISPRLSPRPDCRSPAHIYKDSSISGAASTGCLWYVATSSDTVSEREESSRSKLSDGDMAKHDREIQLFDINNFGRVHNDVLILPQYSGSVVILHATLHRD